MVTIKRQPFGAIRPLVAQCAITNERVAIDGDQDIESSMIRRQRPAVRVELWHSEIKVEEEPTPENQMADVGQHM